MIEELNIPISKANKGTLALISPFWQTLNLFVREGLGSFKIFEHYDDEKQLILMRVASCVFEGIFSHQINFSGPAIARLVPHLCNKHDLRSTYTKGAFQKPLTTTKPLGEAINELINEMRADPNKAREFRDIMKTFHISEWWMKEIDKCLKELGVLL